MTFSCSRIISWGSSSASIAASRERMKRKSHAIFRNFASLAWYNLNATASERRTTPTNSLASFVTINRPLSGVHGGERRETYSLAWFVSLSRRHVQITRWATRNCEKSRAVLASSDLSMRRWTQKMNLSLWFLSKKMSLLMHVDDINTHSIVASDIKCTLLKCMHVYYNRIECQALFFLFQPSILPR